MSPGSSLHGRSSVLAWVIPHLLAHATARGAARRADPRLPGIRGADLHDPDHPRAGRGGARGLATGGRDHGGRRDRSSHGAGDSRGRSGPARVRLPLEPESRERVRAVGALRPRDLGSGGLPVHARRRVAARHDRRRRRGGRSLAARRLLPRVRGAAVPRSHGLSVSPREVRFAGPRPDSLFEHRTFFRAALGFEESANGLVYRSADTRLPLRGADPGLAASCAAGWSGRWPSVPRGGSAAGDARRVILVLPRGSHGAPWPASWARRSPGVASAPKARFRVSGRGPRRRATALLRDPSIGIGEIAFLLGTRSPRRFTARSSAGRARRRSPSAGPRSGLTVTAGFERARRPSARRGSPGGRCR